MGHEVSRDPFLIVAGTYRAGSTALFRYLADHPRVAPAKRKETGYFLPPGDGGRDPLTTYLQGFDPPATPPGVKVEATPSYLHEPEVAHLINETLPASRIVITLRDQLPWLVSWYHTIVLMQLLDPALSFDEYITRQLDDPRPLAERPAIDRAVHDGLFASRVEAFIDVFGPDRVNVVWFDELRSTPTDTMRGIATFAGIEPSFYDSYKPQRVNASARIQARRTFNSYLAVRPQLRRVLRRRLRRLDLWVVHRLMKPVPPTTIGPETRARLREFYRDDHVRLAAAVGRPVPWASA